MAEAPKQNLQTTAIIAKLFDLDERRVHFGLASTAGLLRASQYLARLLGAGSFAPWSCVPHGGLCVALWRPLWPVVWLCLPSALGARVRGSGGLVLGGLGGLSHGPLYVVVEALAQLGVDCLLDCLAGSAVYHLRHG